MGFMIIQELESRYGHGVYFSVQLAIPIVYLSEVHSTVVDYPATKVLGFF